MQREVTDWSDYDKRPRRASRLFLAFLFVATFVFGSFFGAWFVWFYQFMGWRL